MDRDEAQADLEVVAATRTRADAVEVGQVEAGAEGAVRAKVGAAEVSKTCATKRVAFIGRQRVSAAPIVCILCVLGSQRGPNSLVLAQPARETAHP